MAHLVRHTVWEGRSYDVAFHFFAVWKAIVQNTQIMGGANGRIVDCGGDDSRIRVCGNIVWRFYVSIEEKISCGDASGNL